MLSTAYCIPGYNDHTIRDFSEEGVWFQPPPNFLSFIYVLTDRASYFVDQVKEENASRDVFIIPGWFRPFPLLYFFPQGSLIYLMVTGKKKEGTS
jgi:hypothetical protein